VHLERGDVDQEARADELVVQVMLAQDVAHVLAEKALDALPELLHPVDVPLRHAPGAVRRPAAAPKGAICAFTRKFHETSVTRSRSGGNVRMGSIVTGSDSGSEFNRVMHMRRGRPLISAEHEPHLPALQFHRHARSGACSAWMRCTASSTTIPSEISVV
jgi:hypothetical protein